MSGPSPHPASPRDPPGARLELAGITKRFGDAVALDEASLDLSPGECLFLLGENGAGKSTLMNILYGLVRPDSGRIRLGAAPLSIRSPRDAIARGIGMVHQHFMLVEPFTVAENLALHLPGAAAIDPAGTLADRIAACAAAHGLPVDPHARVADLSPGERQRVEIVKALLSGAAILILDEPTSVLAPAEADRLLEAVRRFVAAGMAVIHISHKLDEIPRVADRVAVLRRGRVVADRSARAADPAELVRLMVGGEPPRPRPARPAPSAEPLLEVTGLSVDGPEGRAGLDGISFALRKGEVLGVAGVAGNGQTELTEALTGIAPLRAGSIRLLGEELAGRDARGFVSAGIAHIPEDRLRDAVCRDFSLAENAGVRDGHLPPHCARGMVDRESLLARARRIVAECRVEPPDPHAPAGALSGGNLQKFIVGRELSADPRLIVAAHPTYGVDVVAADLIRARLLRECRDGAGLVVVSEDLDELLALADRIAVLFRGRFAAVIPRAGATREAVGRFMTGETI